MLEQDYIMNLLNQFFADLAKFLQKKKDYLSEDDLKQLYNEYFHSAEFYRTNSIENILKSLEEYPQEEQIYRLQMLAELIFQDGLQAAAKDDDKTMLLKACGLFEFWKAHSQTFSFDVEMKLQEAKRILES